VIPHRGMIWNLLICLLQIGDRPGEDVLFVIDPSEGIGDMGVIRELFLGALDQIEGFVDVFSLLGVEIGKIIAAGANLGLIFKAFW